MCKAVFDEVAYYVNIPVCRNVPIFERPPPKYSAHYIMRVLLDPNIDTSRVATGRPIGSTSNATFIVDLSKLQHPDDVKKDMFGKWEHSGSHPEVFKCSFDDLECVSVEKCAPGASGINVYYLRRLRSYCPTNHDVRRLMAFIHGTYVCIKQYVYSGNFITKYMCNEGCSNNTNRQYSVHVYALPLLGFAMPYGIYSVLWDCTVLN